MRASRQGQADKGKPTRASRQGQADKGKPTRASLYFGDNLGILRDEIKDESIDLIYLDPPFNSKADYSILLKTSDNIKSIIKASSNENDTILDPFCGCGTTVEAVTAKSLDTPLGQKYPKLQIYTIKDYFERRPPKLPTMTDYITSKRAVVKSTRKDRQDKI